MEEIIPCETMGSMIIRWHSDDPLSDYDMICDCIAGDDIADLICKAVNNHDRLVEQLRSYKDDLQMIIDASNGEFEPEKLAVCGAKFKSLLNLLKELED